MLKISNRQQALEEICNKFTDEFRALLLYEGAEILKFLLCIEQ